MVIMRRSLLHLALIVFALYGLENVEAAEPSGDRGTSRADVVDETPQQRLLSAQSAQLSAARSQPLATQLSALRDIVVDVLQRVEAGDLPAARKRIDDLEHAWTRIASDVKSVEPDQAKAIESAIDRAERELRFWRARRTDSAEALRQVVNLLDAFK